MHFIVFCFLSFQTGIQPAAQGSHSIGTDSLTIFVFLHDECVISQFFTPQLGKFYKEYGDNKVGFAGYFPDATVETERIYTFGKKYNLQFPLQQDHDKMLTNKLGIRIMPEVAVWDHRSEQMIYRGRIDDSYVRVGKRRLHPQNHDLKNVIESWLKKEPQTFRETQAIGCIIGK
jgi:hypothetical protein